MKSAQIRLFCALLVLVVLCPRAAVAEDHDFTLMSQPTSYTDVADAFDDHNPVDFRLTLGIDRSQSQGTIRRELAGEGAAPGGNNFFDVAHHSHLTNTLLTGLEVGLYHDVMIYGRKLRRRIADQSMFECKYRQHQFTVQRPIHRWRASFNEHQWRWTRGEFLSH